MNITKIKHKTIAAALLLAVALGGAACGVVRNPFRDYSRKPFSAAAWRAGDAIERGRMITDIDDRIFAEGRDREGVLKVLGEPDEKEFANGREVWLYRIEFQYRSSMNRLPVTFDPRYGAFIGSF